MDFDYEIRYNYLYVFREGCSWQVTEVRNEM